MADIFGLCLSRLLLYFHNFIYIITPYPSKRYSRNDTPLRGAESTSSDDAKRACTKPTNTYSYYQMTSPMGESLARHSSLHIQVLVDEGWEHATGASADADYLSFADEVPKLLEDRQDQFDDDSSVLGPQPASPNKSIQKSPIEDLPAELKDLLLRHAPDVQTLTVLSQTSRDFRNAYKFSKRGILFGVLRKQMGPHVFAYAVANLRASRLKHGDHDEIKLKKFLNTFHRPEYEKSCPADLAVADLEAISQFYSVVSYFVMDFSRYALKVRPATDGALGQEIHLTDTERARIAGAFYLFELFCRLFRCKWAFAEGPDGSRTWEPLMKRGAAHFLSLFNAYEVEELACIRDYVLRNLTNVDRDVSEDLARNPSRWIRRETDRINAEYRPRGWKQRLQHGLLKQHFEYKSPLWIDWMGVEGIDYRRIDFFMSHDASMAKGLLYLRRLFDCADRENRMDIYAEDLESIYNHPFLCEALGSLPYRLVQDKKLYMPYYEAYVHEDTEAFEGDGHGCNAAWAWANNYVAEQRYAQCSRKTLREWGYVMWDRPRLAEWGILRMDNSKYRLAPDEIDIDENLEGHVDSTLQDLRERHLKICKRASDHPSCRGEDEVLEDEKVEEEEEEDVEEDDETASTTSNRSSSISDSGTDNSNDGDSNSVGIEELRPSDYGSLASDLTEPYVQYGCCMKKWWRDLMGACSRPRQEFTRSVSTKIKKVKTWLRKPRGHKKGSEILSEIPDAEDDTPTPVPTRATSDEGTGACNPRFWEQRFAVQNPEPVRPTQPSFNLATWLAATSSPGGPNTPALASQALFDRKDTPSTFTSRSDSSSEFGIVTAVELENPFLDTPKSGQSLDPDLECTTQDFVANCAQDTASPGDNAHEPSDEFSWGSTSTAVSSSGGKKSALLKLLIKPKGILHRKGKCTTVGAEPAAKISGTRTQKWGGESFQEIRKHIKLTLKQYKPTRMQHSTTDTGCRDESLTLRERWTHEVYEGIPQAGASYEQSHTSHTGLFQNEDKSKPNVKRYKKIQKSEKETLLQMEKLAKERGIRLEMRKHRAAGPRTAWERFEAWTYEQSYLI